MEAFVIFDSISLHCGSQTDTRIFAVLHSLKKYKLSEEAFKIKRLASLTEEKRVLKNAKSKNLLLCFLKHSFECNSRPKK